MKHLITLCFACLACLFNSANAQNIAINTDGSLPDASAMLDLTSTSKGFLTPRMTTLQQNAISSPATGLLIYNTTDNVFKVNTGTPASPVWTSLASASNSWQLTGNSATNAASDFLGTTDNISLALRTNNLQRMVIDGSGRVGVGVTNPTNPFVVKDTFEIRRTATVSQLLFSNTAGFGDFRIGSDGSDLFWQGGGGRNLQMGAYWGIQLMGDRQSGSFPAYAAGVANTGVLIQAQRDASVPLAIQSNTATQSANLTEWRNSAGTVLDLLDKNGNLSIGGSAFNGTYPEKLLVDAGTTTSVNAIVGKGSINNYLQLNIQNNSAGANASSDVVATANNGSETTNYVDMGINGGGNTSNIMGTANDAYLYNIGQNFLLGTGSTGKSLMFLTGGTDSATNERMRIDGTGNVGIGVANPTNRLQVNATSNPLKLVGLQTGTNADSVLTVSNGVVKRLHASALTTSSSNAWSLTGNAGTASTKLGTTNTYDLPFITDNTTRMTITSSGRVGIGSTDFDTDEPELLLVDGGTAASSNLIGAFANVNKYVQIGVQNMSSGNSASSDIVATADNGTNTTNYIDMGINSSGYANNASNILNRPNVGYLYTNATSDFFIGNGSTDEDMIFFTNNGPAGNTTANGFEAIRIDGNGNVGIGGTSRNNLGVKTTNAEKLVVQGNIIPRTSGNGTIGTSTYKWNAVYATNGTIQTSDKRMKTNIANLKYGLKEVLELRPVSFNWKTTPDSNKKVGLIAQEVREIVPEVVVGDEAKESLGVNYAELIPVLINAVKEQQKEIAALKIMVAKLQEKK